MILYCSSAQTAKPSARPHARRLCLGPPLPCPHSLTRHRQERATRTIHRDVLNANKGCPPSIPKFGFRSLHAATTCGSSGGKGLVACFRCGVPAIIGLIQSTAIPTPILVPSGTKPACVHGGLSPSRYLRRANSQRRR